jgi:hypothetical protein
MVSSTTANECTDFVTVTCPDDFLAVRAGFTNIRREAYVVTKVIAAASTTLGDHANPTGASCWRPLTFANNGVPTDKIVAAADAPTTIIVRGMPPNPTFADDPLPSWTWTDWAPLTSLPRAESPDAPRVLMIRLLLPKDCTHTYPNGGFMEYHLNPAINRGSSYVAGQVPRDVVTVPEVINTAGANIGIAFPAVSCIQFLTRNEGIVGMAAGDSHHQGTSTTTQFWNYLMRSTLEIGSRQVGRIPFGYWSTARGGATSDWFFRPGFVVLPGWTYNDTTLNAQADQEAIAIFLARLLMTAEECARSGAVPIFLTPFPRDPAAMTAARVEPWRALRNAIVDLRERGAVVLDATAILARQVNGVMDGTYRPEYTDDTVHPNNAGHAAVAAALTPIIERICRLA